MTIIDSPLTVNPFSRCGRKLVGVQALIIHWTANPGQRAHGVIGFYQQRSLGNDGYGSAHYVIDLNGEAVRMIPEDEIAYHCGTSQLDPTSGKFYTDAARAKFGQCAVDYKDLSPNLVTIGVEHCITDTLGTMPVVVVDTSLNLSADICKRHGLDPLKDIWLHKEVVGWKDCHKWYVDNPDAWANYKAMVKQRMA